MTSDERAIRELIRAWMDASKAGDAETVLTLMADDVIFMVPGREPFGKEEFRAAQEEQKGTFEGTADIRELRVLGDWAYLRSYLTVDMKPVGDGKPIRRNGHTLTILRKEADGRWVLARDANLLTADG